MNEATDKLPAPGAAALSGHAGADNISRSAQVEDERRMRWKNSLIALGFGWLAVILLFWRDVQDMVQIWWHISTYNHILLIPPIIAWLVHQRLDQLRQVTPLAWWPGLFMLAIAALGWILGEAADLNVARHLAVIMMLQAMVIILLGRHATKALAFPIFYAFFMLPIGEELVPALQHYTAIYSADLLNLTGPSAHLDGVFITTATGYFEVAESCSGVKFLIAMVAYGALVCNVCYSSYLRRALFIGVCIIVPVLANIVRVWGTIVIAHHTSIDFAASFDHIFYGWIFFAVVLLLVMAIGWRYFDRPIEEDFVSPEHSLSLSAQSDDRAQRMRKFYQKPGYVAAMAIALLLVPIGWNALPAGADARLDAHMSLPQVKGWQQVSYHPASAWEPATKGASKTLLTSYARGDDRVEIFAAVYAGMDEKRDMTGFGQGALVPESHWSWTANGAAVANGKSEQLVAPGPVRREALTFYHVNGLTTGSASRIKLELARSRLFKSGLPGVMLIISAEDRGNRTARAMIDDFMQDMGSVDLLAERLLQSPKPEDPANLAL